MIYINKVFPYLLSNISFLLIPIPCPPLYTLMGGIECIFMISFIDLVYNLNQLMNNQQFEVKLLVKQNTEMVVKLQSYRKENQELTKKNQNLNCWVQNLSEVFASLSAAWKAITDNEEAFYTLMRKKVDPNAKAIVSKYIAHFKAFDEIITNLGDKITNEGHSQAATIDAKARLASFVSNYNLFFMEFVEAYFKFNDEYITYINQKTEGQNIQPFLMQLKTKELENRQKIKQFQSYFGQFKENLKIYDNYNQHKLLDGIILEKNKEIEELKDQNLKKSRKIAYMTDYCTKNIEKIAQNEEVFACTCGGAQLEYYSRAWQESLKKSASNNTNQKSSSQIMIDEVDQKLLSKINQLQDFNAEKELLLQRNVQCLNKLQKLKLQNRLTEEAVLQSPVFLSLKQQFTDLMDYTNSLIQKLNKSYEYLNQIQKARLQEIEQLRKKYEKPSNQSRSQSDAANSSLDHKFLVNFKDSVLKEMSHLSSLYQTLCKDGKEREDKLQQVKDQMRSLKKQNEDLNRKLNDLQDKMAKSVDHLQYRHSKFNELEAKIVEMFRAQPQSEDIERLKKLWEEYVDYVKTRDKKIKAMQDQIRKKEKEIAQKNKLEEVLKTALSQTEAIYVQSKDKLDKFEQFREKMEKEILNLSEENYKLKIEGDKQKNFLNIRLKNQLQVKGKLEDRVKHLQKMETEMKLLKEKEVQVDKKLQEFNEIEKDSMNKIKVQLKEKQREFNQLNVILQEKDKSLEKIIEDKEKKNLEISKLKSKLRAIEEKTEYEVILLEMEGYKNKIMCSCGAQREREVVLTTCPHIFCKKCIEDSVGNRNRKCPLCGIKFNKNDVREICWN